MRLRLAGAFLLVPAASGAGPAAPAGGGGPDETTIAVGLAILVLIFGLLQARRDAAARAGDGKPDAGAGDEAGGAGAGPPADDGPTGTAGRA